MKTYSELIKLPAMKERFDYLKCDSIIGEETFGSRRYLCQQFYKSYQWTNDIRPKVIVRDEGCDMAHKDYPINGEQIILIHHINPITIDDILNENPIVTDLENLVCVTARTHRAIHYGTFDAVDILKERTMNDTIPWR